MAGIDELVAREVSKRNTPQGQERELTKDKDDLRKENVAIAEAWPEYEELLTNEATKKIAYKIFEENHQKFVAAAAKLVDDRTDDLLAWVESKSLLDSLTEFHGDSIEDSVAFDDKIGLALHGIDSSLNGRNRIEAWVKEMKATEGNLIWRTMGLNNEAATAALNRALEEAERHKLARTVAEGLEDFNYLNKTLKAFADIYKKAVTLENSKISAVKGSSAFGVKIDNYRTGGLDTLMVGTGNLAFKSVQINNLGEFLSEKIMQHIFSIRGFVDPAESLKLIDVQAKNAAAARVELKRRMKLAGKKIKTKVPVPITQETALRTAWENFRKSNAKGAATTAIKDSKLALLVMLIEGCECRSETASI